MVLQSNIKVYIKRESPEFQGMRILNVVCIDLYSEMVQPPTMGYLICSLEEMTSQSLAKWENGIT